MGGEGSMMHAIKSLQENRALLKNKRRKNYTAKSGVKTELQFKKATPEAIKQAKLNAQKEQRRYWKIVCFTTVIFVSIFFYLFWRLYQFIA